MTKVGVQEKLKTFQRSEEGAVQVDWVHLTVVAVGMGLLLNSSLVPVVGRVSETLTADISKALKRPEPKDSPSSRPPRTTY